MSTISSSNPDGLFPNARDTKETRRELQRHGSDELRQLRDQIEDSLERVEDQVDSTEETIRNRVRHILTLYGADTGGVDPEEEARKVIQGSTSEPLNDALRCLTLRAEETEDKRRSVVYRGRVQELQRLFRRLKDLDERKGELRHRRDVAKRLLDDWSAGRVELGIEPEEKGTDLPSPTAEYLDIAHKWIEADNRPSGDKPTELWKHVASKTGKSTKAVRETFKNRGWYDPHAQPSPTEYTIQAIRKAAKRHLG